MGNSPTNSVIHSRNGLISPCLTPSVRTEFHALNKGQSTGICFLLGHLRYFHYTLYLACYGVIEAMDRFCITRQSAINPLSCNITARKTSLSKYSDIQNKSNNCVGLIFLSHKTPFGWHPGAETCRPLILIKNCVLFRAFFG